MNAAAQPSPLAGVSADLEAVVNRALRKDPDTGFKPRKTLPARCVWCKRVRHTHARRCVRLKTRAPAGRDSLWLAL
jgi:hypothetical protein